MPFVKANNANFYYELHGKGQPVILISGYTGDHLVWLPILEGLIQHFQVLIFDNRAVGQTTDTGEPFLVETLAKDVIAIADQLDLKNPHIVGQSMGGSIAQVVAGAYPEKIGDLALLTSSAKWRVSTMRGFKSLLMMREQNVNFDIIFDNLISWVFSDLFLKNENDVEIFKQAVLENPYPQTLADQTRQFNMLKAFDGNTSLQRIRARTLIVNGVEDVVSLPYESRHLASEIMGAKQAEFDCAHGIMYEVPEKLVSTLVEFFK